MTGPDLPRGVGGAPIGEFTIGVDAIGAFPAFDVWETVLSQYANSPILTKIIFNFFDYIDPTKNLQSFFDLIWNVDTAQGYGLDVWGRIVGVNRILHLNVGKWFGFQEMGTVDADPFGQSAFWSGTPITQNYFLTDSAYRTLIFVKAAANITDGSIPAINRMLMTLFAGRGNAFVTEGEDFQYFGFAEGAPIYGFNQAPFYDGAALPRMRMTYTFMFKLSPVDEAIVVQSGVLPKPTGVKARVVQIY